MLQYFLHLMTQTMCCDTMGSPDPLGFSTAFWEHDSPRLTGFFWKMSPASDESESCFSAACPVLHARRQAVLCCAALGSLQAFRCRCLDLNLFAEKGEPFAASTHAGRSAGSSGWQGCIQAAGASGTDRHFCAMAPWSKACSWDLWPRHFHSSCNCDSQGPAMKVVHQNDYQSKGKESGWKAWGSYRETSESCSM